MQINTFGAYTINNTILGDSMSILAIDIGGSSFKYGLVTLEGTLHFKETLVNRRIDQPKFLEDLVAIITKVQATHEFEGIALSVPSGVNPSTGEIMLDGCMPFLKGFSLSSYLTSRYKVPVHSENDGNCAALAEAWKGAGAQCQDIALVVIGTGIGGGIIKNKKVHSGANWVGGEIGYGIFDYNDQTDTFTSWSDNGAIFGLSERIRLKTGNSYSGKTIFERAELGDVIIQKEVERFFLYNALGIFNLQYTFDPEMILIGGGISTRDGFIEKIYEKLDALLERIPHATVRPVVKAAVFGNDANIIGAAYNYIQRT